MRWKIREWSSRYLLSEIIASVTAISAAIIADLFIKNSILTAIAGTWGENAGYYGSIVIRDILISRRKNGILKIENYIRILKNLLLEFGIAEMLDSFFIRPFTMYFFSFVIKNIPIGILLGKLSADIIFYIPTIFSYELRKKYLKD